MKNKQNNDDSQHENKRMNPSQNISSPKHLNDNKAEKQKNIQTNMKNNQQSSGQSSLKQSQKKQPNQKKPSIVVLQPIISKGKSSASLPITIQQLDEKTLNMYLKQFMQISTFQAIQKGKQLIDLVKQAPASKQSTWVINKSCKLFKSSIPEAVLCSFQFIRQLIEIAHYKITEALQQLLLMQMVEIIEYRSYVPNMERGNSYFLSQFYRYCKDEKTNHLIKIGSTFFRMVHEALYVWGTLYFPESNFSKMLNKLITQTKINFPVYPQEFKFYSQARVKLFLAIQSKNNKEYKKKPQKNKQKESKGLDKVQKEQNIFEKTASKSIQKVIFDASQAEDKSTKAQVSKQLSLQDLKIKSPVQKIISHQSKQSISTPKSVNQQKAIQSKAKNQKNNKKNQTPRKDKVKNKIQDQQLQCIQLTKKPQSTKQDKVSFAEINQLQQYKRMKPSKLKAKKSSLVVGKSQNQIFKEQQKQSQNGNKSKIKISDLNDVYDPLNLLEKQVEIQAMEIVKQRVNENVETKTEEKQKKVLKELLKIDLKKIKQRSQSETQVRKIQQQSKAVSIKIEQHTFRPAQYHSNTSDLPTETENQSSRREYTARIQSTERERFNIELTEESDERMINRPVGKERTTQSNDFTLEHQNLMAEFLKKEFQSLKNSLIDSIKKDIVQNMHSTKEVSKEIGQKAHGNSQTAQSVVNKQKIHLKHPQTEKQDHHQMEHVSGRFGSNQDDNPSIMAFEFIKKKQSNRNKLRAVSKRNRTNIIKDLQVNQQEVDQSDISHMKENQDVNIQPKKEKKEKKNCVDNGVNTQELGYEKIYEEISSLKQKLNSVTLSQTANNKDQLLSKKRQNNLIVIPSKIHSNSFFKTPYAINKIQEENLKPVQLSSLRSTCNSTRKRSSSKLSERRSSLETSLFQKAIRKPEKCGNQFGQFFGGSNTLLFNAAISTVNKRRKSVMFC